jgi:hypothetical protein
VRSVQEVGEGVKGMNFIKHKGHIGTVEYSSENKVLFGKTP